MKKLKNELTWSFSRDRLFRECRRAYFYHYYASWGGWEAGADEFIRKAYILKNVRNTAIWAGDIVHQIIKWILETKIAGLTASNQKTMDFSSQDRTFFKTDKDIPFEQARDKAKQLLMRTWEQSRSKMWMKNVKHNLNLFEHYYKRELTREELALKLQKVIKSIRNIYNSGLIESFSSLLQENFLRIDELDSFELEGIRIFAIPDFAIKNGEYVLYDWKTGKRSDKDILQLSCYRLYAMNKWKVEADKIRVIPVYLAEEKVSFEPVTPIEANKVKSYIFNSVDEMKSVLFDVKENKTDIEHCPKIKDSWRCKNCKFQEICE